MKKWGAILESENYEPIKDSQRKLTVAKVLENTEVGLNKGELSYLTESGAVAANYSQDLQGDRKGYDPILFSLIRRAMPNLVAYDIMGTQAMAGPTGLLFALRPKFVTGAGTNNPTLGGDAFYDEADSDFSGTGTHAGTSPAVLNAPTPGTYTYGTGMSTLTGERLGTAAGTAFQEMGFSIDKVTLS